MEPHRSTTRIMILIILTLLQATALVQTSAARTHNLVTTSAAHNTTQPHKHGGCLSKEHKALLAFKAGIKHDPDSLLSTWTGDGNCCTWKAITCDKSTGHITHLELFVDPKHDSKTHSLRGTISPALGNLIQLKVLDLHNLKQLSGPLPGALGKLKHLLDFNVEGNLLTGSIPSSFGGLKTLKTLRLSNNRFSGVIPPTLGNIGTQLHVLWLGKNKLSGTIPAALYKLTGLDSFYLGSNKLTGQISPLIGRLKKMKSLDFSDNKLTGKIPQAVATNLTKLDYLNLSNNRLSGAIPNGATFSPSSINGNTGLCGHPLPPCRD